MYYLHGSGQGAMPSLVLVSFSVKDDNTLTSPSSCHSNHIVAPDVVPRRAQFTLRRFCHVVKGLCRRPNHKQLSRHCCSSLSFHSSSWFAHPAALPLCHSFVGHRGAA